MSIHLFVSGINRTVMIGCMVTIRTGELIKFLKSGSGLVQLLFVSDDTLMKVMLCRTYLYVRMTSVGDVILDRSSSWSFCQ